jgi:putative oxidoreductase
METAATIIQVLLAVIFLGAGGAKLAGVQMQVANFERYGYSQRFRLITGAVEVIGAAGMIAGLFVDEVAIAAAAVLAVTMVGAAYTDARHSPPAMIVAPLVLLVLSLLVVVLRVA